MATTDAVEIFGGEARVALRPWAHELASFALSGKTCAVDDGRSGSMLFGQNIRKADDVIASTTTQQSGWGSELTHFAVLGTPSTTAPWMLQICQHHLVYNIVDNGSLVSATPVFLGTEPPNFAVLPDGTTLVNGSSVTFVNGQMGTAPADAGTAVQVAAVDPQRSAVNAVTTAILADSNVATAAKIGGSFSDVVYGINTSTGGDSNYPFSATLGDTLVYPTGTTGRGALDSALTAPVHGLAFAGVIAELGLSPLHLSLAIFGFNVGIEIMQLAVVALTAPWLMLLARTSVYPSCASPAQRSQAPPPWAGSRSERSAGTIPSTRSRPASRITALCSWLGLACWRWSQPSRSDSGRVAQPACG